MQNPDKGLDLEKKLKFEFFSFDEKREKKRSKIYASNPEKSTQICLLQLLPSW